MKINKRLWHLMIVIVLVAFDQITKIMAANAFSDGSIYIVFEDVLQLVFSKNTGASWGILKGMNPFFTVLISIVVLLVIWFYFSLPVKKRYNPLRLATIVLLSGALGNLIDRIRVGYVIDFIYFELIDFPVFNLADSYITIAAIGLILLIIIRYRNDDIKFLSFKKSIKKDTDSNQSDNDVVGNDVVGNDVMDNDVCIGEDTEPDTTDTDDSKTCDIQNGITNEGKH